MFDFDAGKLLIVGVIALIFIPTKDLPRVLRQVGQFVGKMRRMAADFQGQFMDAMREADVADIRREAQKLADAARVDVGLDSLHDLDRQMVAKRPAEKITEPTPLIAAEPTVAIEPKADAAHDAPTSTAQHSA